VAPPPGESEAERNERYRRGLSPVPTQLQGRVLEAAFFCDRASFVADPMAVSRERRRADASKWTEPERKRFRVRMTMHRVPQVAMCVCVCWCVCVGVCVCVGGWVGVAAEVEQLTHSLVSASSARVCGDTEVVQPYQRVPTIQDNV
jgi:hypothetical protein